MWIKIAAGLAATLTALTLAGATAAADDGTSCATVRIPVALGAGQPKDQEVSGTLCVPGAYTGGVRRVDVLVHGGTFNSSYWQWPQNPGLYSYAAKTTAAGRASFAYDRPGSGASTRPPSTALTIAADAHVLHQVIQWLRGRDFAQTTVIGHSVGAMMAIAEAATFNDTDRLVLTGALHPPALGLGAVVTVAGFSPAALDPAFAGQPIDVGYLTTRPGARAGSFYYTPAADPAVIAYDEAHKDIMSGDELVDAFAHLAVPVGLNDANRVRADVLAIVGDHDGAVCGLVLDCTRDENVRANEAPYYTSAASLTGDSVPNTGHALTLHPSAGTSFARIDQWIKTH